MGLNLVVVDRGGVCLEFSVSSVCSWMNVGQNGDPDDCVRFGYLWGLNGGEAGLLGGLGLGHFSMYSDASVCFILHFLLKPPELLIISRLTRCC